MRTALACLAAGLLLALAAPAALAQNAGDQQYQDPLADNSGDSGNNSGNGSSNGNSSGNGDTAPSTQTETAQANGDDTAQDGLPRTGLDAWLLVIAGTAMLGGGFALRRVADRTGT